MQPDLPRSHLGRLLDWGPTDFPFNPGTDGPVNAVALQSDGRILVGGAFGVLGGQEEICFGRLNADGSTDTSVAVWTNAQVRAMAVQPDGKILIGGDFTTLEDDNNGLRGTFNHLGRVNAAGALDESFNPGVNGSVYALAVQADGKILVGGEFTSLGGGLRKKIGRLNADGSLDTSFDPGANGAIYGLAVQGDGKILAGGAFIGLGGGSGTTSRPGIGRLTNTGAAIQRLRVTNGGSVVTWSHGGAGPEVWRVTFESSSTGVAYTLLGSGTRVADGWQLSGQSLPANQNLFVRARGFYATGLGMDPARSSNRCWLDISLSGRSPMTRSSWA